MNMDYSSLSKEGRFFPNECYICKSTNELIRCVCHMISYCGKDHKMLHRPIHATFCKAVVELSNEKNKHHIYEELLNVLGGEWFLKRREINKELTGKLGRPMSCLERSMFYRPRICFVCRKFNQGDLKNCPRCPIATFCKEHQDSKLHDDACAVMRKYLNMLKTADELNIDLQFLPSCFPFIMEEMKSIFKDVLTDSIRLVHSEVNILKSRLTKINLCDFISVASKLHVALKKMYYIVPAETTIHINALHFTHAIVKENYWEFLLHMSQDIKSLKIVIIGIKDFNNLETSLCKNCHLMEKTLLIEVDSRPYEQYMLDENYKMPNILFSCAIDNGSYIERIKAWNQYDCPIVLALDSIETFRKTKYILEDSSVFEIIYGGQIYSPFDDSPASGNREHYIIFKSKGNSCTEGNSSRTIKSKENESVLKSGDNSDAKINAKQNPNVESSSLTSSGASSESTISDSHAKEIENGETNLKQTESRNDNCYTTENDNKKLELEVIETHVVSKDDDKHEKIIHLEKETEDVESLSSSSSFIIIPEPGNNDSYLNRDGNEDAEQVDNKTVEEPSNDDYNVKGVENQKLIADKNIIEQTLEEVAKKANESQIITSNLEDSYNEGQLNFSHSFLRNHVTFLQNENKRQQDEIKRQQDENEILRTQLTASVEVVTRLQNKIAQLQGIFSSLVKKHKLIREAAHDVDVDICSALEEKMFEI